MIKNEYDECGILRGYTITTKTDMKKMLNKELKHYEDIEDCLKKLNNYDNYEYYDANKYFSIKRISQRKYEITVF